MFPGCGAAVDTASLVPFLGSPQDAPAGSWSQPPVRPGARPFLLLWGLATRRRSPMALVAHPAGPEGALRAVSAAMMSASFYSVVENLVPLYILPPRATSWRAGSLSGVVSRWLCLPLREAVYPWHPRACL